MGDHANTPENRIWIPDEEYARWLREMYPRLLQQELTSSGSPKDVRFLMIDAAAKKSIAASGSLERELQGQTWPEWRLYRKGLEERSGHVAGDKPDKRIQDVRAEQSTWMKDLAGAALEDAKACGSRPVYIGFAGPDCRLEPEMLQALAAYLTRCGENLPEVLYTDSDLIMTEGDREYYASPSFRPEFSPDLLRSLNYIGGLAFFSADLMRELLMDGSVFWDAAWELCLYDLLLHAAEKTERFSHLALPLYHRSPEAADAHPEVSDAGADCVRTHLSRLGITADVNVDPEHPVLHAAYPVDTGSGKVSIIVPNKDHVEDLKTCMDSIDRQSLWRDLEWIIVENNSTQPETFRYYEEISTRADVQVLHYQGDFNYSRLNNLGASKARGEYLLLLNNDTEMIRPDSIKEMLGLCRRRDVGIAGAKLLYPDRTVQHAGVVLGPGGIAAHAFAGAPADAEGYEMRIAAIQDLSLVTAACLMVPKTVYDAVGGFTEKLAVAFNDVDFCLKVRQTGKRVVYTPYSCFWHYESKSRGADDTPEKAARFEREVYTFWDDWRPVLDQGDPYYSRNLTLEVPPYRCRFVPAPEKLSWKARIRQKLAAVYHRAKQRLHAGR